MGRYIKIKNKKTRGGKNIKLHINILDIPLSFDDIYVYTEYGDRFDILAQTILVILIYGGLSQLLIPNYHKIQLSLLWEFKLEFLGIYAQILLDYNQLNSNSYGRKYNRRTNLKNIS